jgi:hypothetical protein
MTKKEAKHYEAALIETLIKGVCRYVDSLGEFGSVANVAAEHMMIEDLGALLRHRSANP